MSSPITFTQKAFSGAPVREKELRYLVDAIRHGKCCAVVAPSNMGKSKLLHSLRTEETRVLCTAKPEKPVVMVFTDCLPLETEIDFYRQILNDLLFELEDVAERRERNLNIPLRVLSQLKRDRDELMSTESGGKALLVLDQALRRLLRKTNLKIVFIWDEFEGIFERLPGRTFRKFRALRDTTRAKMICVLGVTRRLNQIRPENDLFEFREVFKMNTLVLQPLNRNDSERFLQYMTEINDYDLDASWKDLVYLLSGGHPGLMERTLNLFARGYVMPESEDVIEALYHDRRLREECRRLWEEIDQSERDTLLDLAMNNTLADDGAAELLLETGILRKKGSRYCIFSPLFARLVLKQLSESKGLELKGNRIYLDDRDITDKLGVGELDLLLFLFKYPGKYFTTPEIYWKLNKKVAEEKDKASIRKSVQRARQVIEPFYHSKECIYLLNKKGSGYMLNPNPGSRGSLSLKELSCNYPGKDEALF